MRKFVPSATRSGLVILLFVAVPLLSSAQTTDSLVQKMTLLNRQIAGVTKAIQDEKRSTVTTLRAQIVRRKS